jgi:aspartate-semialdehyde dehydrogenase
MSNLTKLRVCILGATGIVGQHFVQLLTDHPWFEVAGLAASGRSEGKLYENTTDRVVSSQIPDNVGEITVSSMGISDLDSSDFDIYFSALPADVAFSIEDELAKHGYPIFSNASAHRRSRGVPILIPEINAGHIELIQSQPYDGGYIVTNSNCSTSGLVFGLKPIEYFGITEVLVATYQAISGAGRSGVASMDILSNVIPYIKNEEEKVETETRLILGDLSDTGVVPADFSVNASCARVPVMNGHLESVSVKLNRDLSIEEATEIFSSFTSEPQTLQLPTAPQNPIHVFSEEDRPQPLRDHNSGSSALGMSIKIGRIRKKGDWLNFFLLVHNTIRGAAGASILNAEYALKKGYIDDTLEVDA